MVKLLIYALLAYVAFHFVRRFLNGLGKPAAAPDARRAAERGAPGGTAAERPRVAAQDLVQCPVCGHYVAERCSRTNCPQ